MKRVAIWLAVAVFLANPVYSQTKTLTGTVIDYSQGNKGNWAGITVQAGSQTIFVYINSVDYPAAKTVGQIDRIGRLVRVFYTRPVASSGDYKGAVIAAKIVEIRRAKRGKN